MIASWSRVALLPLVLSTGCGGPPFEGVALEGAAGTGMPMSSDTGAFAAQVATTKASPCPARPADSPALDGEVCLTTATFTMGSNSPNLGGTFADHTPAHSVIVSAFALDAYEVTVARYRACVSAGGCAPVASPTSRGCTYTSEADANEDLPLTCATWSEAQAFCAWDGHRRLPTEAEWEYAARGTNGRAYPWGEDFSCARAVLGGYPSGPCPENAGVFPHRVGSYAQGESTSGIFDLAGNAAEWVADWAGSYDPGENRDPQGPAAGAMRIVRGGSWGSAPSLGLGFARSTSAPDARGPWGFRCARNP